ncbi:MAG: O-antigen ligase family protein [Lentisphaeria bacterium]|nr:O-antigen ligase family protein [Lentisphaeria bacterium]
MDPETKMTDENTIKKQTSYRLGRFYVLLICICLFFSYPLAVIPSFVFSIDSTFLKSFQELQYHLSMPVSFILALFAIPLILASPYRPPRPLLVAMLIFSVSIVGHFLFNTSLFAASISLLAYVLVPYCIAIVHKDTNYLTSKRFLYIISVFWLINIYFGFTQYFNDKGFIGLAGNRNWMAAIIIGLAPWPILLVKHLLGDKKKALFIICSVVICVINLFILYKCDSRAAWLALLIIPFLLVFQIFDEWKIKLLYSTFLICLALTAAVVGLKFFPVKAISVVKADVRLPMWASTVRLIKTKPLGAGPGEFRKAFTPYRAFSTYSRRKVAAHVTVHPHNELLNIAAQIGIPALLSWLIILGYIVFTKAPSPFQLAARFSAIAMLGCSMFDMPMVQQPANILIFIFIGLSLPITKIESDAGPNLSKHLLRTSVSITILAAILISCWYINKDMRRDWHVRDGEIKLHYGKEYLKVQDLKEAKGYFNKSYASYLKAKEKDPSDIDVHFKLAGIALARLFDNKKAKGHIDDVIVLDPNYAHINELKGILLFRKKEYDNAYKYFYRERLLYPNSAAAVQKILNFNLVKADFEKYRDNYVQLQTIYINNAINYLPGISLVDCIGDFRQALKKSDFDASMKHAYKLTEKSDKSFVDALLYMLCKGDSWPRNFMSEYNHLDYLYWKSSQLQMEKMKTIRADGQRPNIADLMEWFIKNQKINDKKDFTPPVVSWSNKQANTLSSYCLFSRLAEFSQYYTLIIFEEGKAVYAICHKNYESYKVNLKTAELTELADFTLKSNQQAKAFFGFQEYYNRNQIIGTIQSNVDPENRFLTGLSPSIRLIKMLVRYRIKVKNLADHCIDDEIKMLEKDFKKLTIKKILEKK